MDKYASFEGIFWPSYFYIASYNDMVKNMK